MDYINKYVDVEKDNTIKISDNERGEISYFSIDQVADLLKEDNSKIRYYTNIFNGILQIEIEDKRLKYKNSDINKLEFLINLKNKGMTVKQIEQYCKETSLSDEEIKEINEKNILTIDDLINHIVQAENENFNKLKEEVSEEIGKETLKANSDIKILLENKHNEFMEKLEKRNDEYLKEIKEAIISEQKKCIDDFKNELKDGIRQINNEILSEFVKDIKQESYNNIKSFKDKLKEEIKIQMKEEFEDKIKDIFELKDKLVNNAEEVIASKIEEQEKELKEKLNEIMDEFINKGEKRDEKLLSEIKKFEEIIKQAYYIQEEVEIQRRKMGLLQKIFG